MRITARLTALALFIAAFVAIPTWAQTAGTAATPSATYAIKGGKVFTLAGAPIEHGTVIIRHGKIVAVGADIAVPSDAQVIDATGLEVYPGLFDPVTQIGLTEVSAVSATQDITELGDYNPELVAATAV
ncbi:MAG: hypothetical protein WB621_26005, partial [Candidatus Acidiferrales bacterium]